ncbi:MAG: response regulator [Verrucomicrobiaceae bacterium]|nr:response regulator [Verrucomicrobiaceae bacterium]
MSFQPSPDQSPLDAPPFTGDSAVLIVDEDPAFQLGLKTFLREYVGFEKVFIARGGQEALDFLRAEPSIDIVSVDYRMPEMSGIELIRALGDLVERPIAVMMITGYPSEELEAEFHSLASRNLLASHFISKPVQFEKLEHLVLEAREEVLEARQRALAAEEEESALLPESSATPDLLLNKLDQHAARLDGLEGELKKQRGKWRSDFWKIAFVLFAFWLASQFGLLQKIEPHWSQLKETIRESVTSLSRSIRPDSVVPAETGPDSTAPVTPAPETPGNRGAGPF